MPWMDRNLFAVGLLTFVNLINYMDRFTIAGVLPDVKLFYDLSDQQEGLLQTCFIVSYMIMAPVFGYLGDRYSRKYIMAYGVAFWSITTYLGSVVPKQAPLLFFFMRALVGTGEASYATIAPTLISDLYIGSKRTQMLGVFYFAIPVGSGLGYIAGAQLANAFSDWRYALRLTPLLGIASAVAMIFCLYEPPRGEADGAKHKTESNFKEDLIYLTKIPTFIWTTIGFTCVCFTTGSLAWWGPSYIIQVSKSINPGENDPDKTVNLIFGLIMAFGGIAGVIIGTVLAEVYRKKSLRADPLICSITTFISVPFVFTSLLLASVSPALTWISIALGITMLCVNWTLVADMILSIIVPHRRSIGQAIEILAAHLLGDAISPYIIGFISDKIKSDNPTTSPATSLEYALYINCFVLVLGGVAFLYASFFIHRDQETAKAEVLKENSIASSNAFSLPNNDTSSSPRSTRLTKFSTEEVFIEDDTSRLVVD